MWININGHLINLHHVESITPIEPSVNGDKYRICFDYAGEQNNIGEYVSYDSKEKRDRAYSVIRRWLFDNNLYLDVSDSESG